MEIIRKKAFLAVGIKAVLREEEIFLKIPRLHAELKRRLNYILIGVEVEDMYPISSDTVGIKIPEGKYLYHIYKGSDLYRAYVDMYDYALTRKINLSDFTIETYDESERAYRLYIKLRQADIEEIF